MSANFEPNPPTRKPGGFPKTTTFPENWVIDDQATARNENKDHHHNYNEEEKSFAEATAETESPFARKLEPFPTKAQTNGSML